MDDDDFGRADPLERIEHKLNRLLERTLTIMADLTALNAAIANLQTAETAAVTELAALAAQVSSLTAGEITQDQIDSLTSQVTDVATALSSATTSAEPAPAPVPVDPNAPAG